MYTTSHFNWAFPGKSF